MRRVKEGRASGNGNRSESGFALLLVFAMAGTIAIMLYSQMPRVAFEAQRDKEDLLIQRGQEYVRAIQLFVSKYPRYPSSMDELEKFGGTRFLRQRYKDPMTGKDEWKLLKINAAGQLENSAVKPADEKKEDLNKFISAGSSMVQTNTPGTGGVNPGLRRRASEGGENAPGPDGAIPAPANPGEAVLGQSANPQGVTPVLPNQQLDPNNPNAQNMNAQNMNGQNMPGNIQQGNFPGNPQGNMIPGQPGQPGQVNPVYPNGVPGAPGAPQGQLMNPAMAAVQSQIMGGRAGFQGQPGMVPPGQQPGTMAGQPGYPTPTGGYPAPAGYGQQTLAQQQYPGQPQYNQQQVPGQQPYQQQYNQQQFPGQQQQYQQQQLQQQYQVQQQRFQQQQQQYQQQQQQFQQQPQQFQQQPQQFQQQPQQYPNQPMQGQPGYPATAATQPGRAGTNPPGPTSAADLIMQNLTQPRQMPGNVPGAPGLSLGGGIAGVASKFEGDSIKIFNERQKYNEWEFVYDPKKDKRVLSKTGGMQGGQPGQQIGQPLGGQQPMGPGMNPMSPGVNPGMNQGGVNPGMNQGMNPGMTQGGMSPGGFNQGGFNQPPNTQVPGNTPRPPGPQQPGTQPPQQGGYPPPQQGYPAPGRR